MIPSFKLGGPVFHLQKDKESLRLHVEGGERFYAKDSTPKAFEKVDQTGISATEGDKQESNAESLILEQLIEIGGSVSTEEWQRVPRDFASNVDHYLYGKARISNADIIHGYRIFSWIAESARAGIDHSSSSSAAGHPTVNLSSSHGRARRLMKPSHSFRDGWPRTPHAAPTKTHVGDCRQPGQGFEFLGYRFEAGYLWINPFGLCTSWARHWIFWPTVSGYA